MPFFFRSKRGAPRASSPAGPDPTPELPDGREGALDRPAPSGVPRAGRSRGWIVAALALPAVVIGLLARHPSPAPIVVVDPSAVDAAVAAPSASVSEASAPVRCPEEAYLSRLAEARKALAKKKLDDAREALDRALICRPDDPTALSERGHTHYLSGDLEKARRDQALAAREAKVPALLATIWFRRGLVDARMRNPDVAKRAFATSVAFGGGQAARDWLEGEDVCAVSIERYGPGSLAWVDRNSEHKANAAPSVAALFSGLDGFDGPVQSDSAAWAKAGVSNPSLPAIVELCGVAVDGHWLVAKGRTSLWAFELGLIYRTYDWTGEGKFSVSTRDDGLVRASGYHAHFREVVDDRGRPGASNDGLVTAVEVYFDPKRERALVVRGALPGQFEEREHVPAPEVRVTAEGVVVRGVGCALEEPWEYPPVDAGGPAPAADASGAPEGGAASSAVDAGAAWSVDASGARGPDAAPRP